MDTIRLALLAGLMACACGGAGTIESLPDAASSSAAERTCAGDTCASDLTGPSLAAGSLLIPMDLSYQSTGMFQAYGLLYQLLRQGVHVYWMIAPNKTWHAAACNTPGDTCAWDCELEGSGVKCPYPTASPDLFATAKVVWDDRGAARDTVLGRHAIAAGRS